MLAALLPRSGTIAPAERAASNAVVAAIERDRLRTVTSTMALAEITWVLARDGVSPDTRSAIVGDLVTGSLLLVPVTPELAVAAAEFRLLHYHRDRAPISYADALFAVTAWDAGAVRLVTLDAPLLAIGDSRIVPPSALELA